MALLDTDPDLQAFHATLDALAFATLSSDTSDSTARDMFDDTPS